MKRFLKAAGAMGIISSPFLLIQSLIFESAGMQNTSLVGVCDLVYMIGWTACIVAMIKINAAGYGGRFILYIQVALLCIANTWNIWVIVDPENTTTLFRILDLFWPISNGWMLVTGIVILRARKLNGIARYVAFIAGLWLPVAFFCTLFFGTTAFCFYLIHLYSVIAFFTLGASIYVAGKTRFVSKQVLIRQAMGIAEQVH